MLKVFLFLFCAPVFATEFFPVAVWYGGGKARAPMLESGARGKKETWRQDIRTIKSLGFNTVRTWIDWATGEPREDRYNFENLDVILELAEEEGLKVFLQVYMDSAPHWLGKKFPDSYFVSSNGAVVEPESSPGYCMDHPGIRQRDLAFYTALAGRVRRSKAFAGWDLWSEPHVINWANPTYISNPEFCFCKNTIAKFRSWLQKKYGSIGKLNEAWYRGYEDWDDVVPGRMSTILSYTDYIDWKTFIAGKLGDDLAARYAAVKDAAPQSIVTSHAAGVGLFVSPHHWEGQSDDWTMARRVDYYGTSFYPKHSAFVDRDVPWRAALLDFTRSFGFAGGGRGFYIGELQGGFGTIALNVSPTVTPEDIRIWAWSALARGAKGVNFYAWYPMSSGYESGGFGLIELDGTVTERARVAGSIARVVDQNQKLFLDARPPKAQVAVVYNPLSYFVGGRQRATAYGGPQGEVASIERDSLLGIHRALFPHNVPLDYIHINHLSPDLLAQYKLVVLPYPLMLPEASAEHFKEYVRRGGALVAEARLGWNNERGYAAERIPGMGLWEVMGCRETAVQTGARGRTALRWTSPDLPGLKPGEMLAARWYEETLEPLREDARVAAEFASGAPAAVMSRYGEGKTLMLGSYVSAAYQSAPTPEVERFYTGLLEWAGVELPVKTSDSGIEVRTLEAGPDTLLFVFRHGKTPTEAIIDVRTAARTAFDLVAQKLVPAGRAGDMLRLRKHVEPSEVWVVRLSPQ
ncbi:MAG: beta-galactosidase [Bryobacteraceae bacterium]|nr:beta-galactosidase [Bryobacterales bacterium]MEB2360074.1 beta-galactosidase [Bryobacterales bacterium]NUN01289.1 beta-galactosidase [Bryobacteraceae bacterium]